MPAYYLHFHETEQREKKPCSWCSMRRLCTRITLKGGLYNEERGTLWACNECLTTRRTLTVPTD